MAFLPNEVRSGGDFFVGYANFQTATNNNLHVCGASLFNPSNSGKNLVIYSIICQYNSSNTGNNLLSSNTSDPSGSAGFTNILTPQLSNLGSSAKSVASCCCSPNGITASIPFPPANPLFSFGMPSDSFQELLRNGRTLTLPPGTGIQINFFRANAGDGFASTIGWLE
jgi:hypothetical protein